MRRPAVLLLGVLLAGPVVAQQAAEQTAQALARAQSLLRQVAQEKATLETERARLQVENARLAREVAGAEAALDEKTAELAAAAQAGAAAQSRLARTEQRLGRTTDQLREVVAKFKAQAAVLRAAQAERDELATRLATAERALAAVERKNLELYRANKAILEELAGGSAWDRLLAKEPLTGIKGVERETLIQHFEDRLFEQLSDSNLEAAAER